MSRIMEYLAPQLVQFMKGYLKRLSSGEKSSRRQSGHVAMSGETRVNLPSSGRLSSILKSL